MFIECEEHQKVWGKEVWICNTEKYCGKFLYIDEGAQLSLHFHSNKDEVFYCLEGKATIHIVSKDGNDLFFIMEAGKAFRVLPNTPHSIAAIQKTVIIEFSSHHEDEDSYRVTKSKPGVNK